MQRLLWLMLLLLLDLGAARAISIDTVPVGNAGNAADTVDADYWMVGSQHLGAVPYDFRIGKYDVTVAQYTAFLNAVAKSDPYFVFKPHMNTDFFDYGSKQIERSGTSGSYTYSVINSRGNQPITFLNWSDAARFVNWLNNGQPTGPEGPGTTETGA